MGETKNRNSIMGGGQNRVGIALTVSGRKHKTQQILLCQVVYDRISNIDSPLLA